MCPDPEEPTVPAKSVVDEHTYWETMPRKFWSDKGGSLSIGKDSNRSSAMMVPRVVSSLNSVLLFSFVITTIFSTPHSRHVSKPRINRPALVPLLSERLSSSGVPSQKSPLLQ
eukprot:7640618-Pyramimonas_sp.AAC.1